MVDVSKLISFEHLLVRKVTCFMLPTTSTPLIFVPCKINSVFGANHMTRISHIYSRLPIAHSLTFWLPETAYLCQLVTHSSIHTAWMRIYSATFFFMFCLFSWTCSSLAHGLKHFIKSWKWQTTHMGENTSS